MTRTDQASDMGIHTTGRLLVFSAASLAAVVGSKDVPPSWPVAPLALAAIAVAIWHGAFDGVLAREVFQPRWGARWSWVFLPTYLMLTTGVLALWYVSPTVALVGFLAYSALHFGTESDTQLSLLQLLTGFAIGFLPIAAACHWSAAQVQAIFAEMLRGDSVHSMAVVSICGRLLWPMAAIAVAATVWNARFANGHILTLVGIELVLFRYCSPLVGFAVFFCLWHTPEHMVSTSRDRNGLFHVPTLRSHLRAGLVPWAASLVALVIACWFGRHSLLAYTGTLFICLSALTVPHMALGEFGRKKGNSSSHGAILQEAAARS